MAGIQGKKLRARVGRLAGLLLLVAILVAGCAEVRSIFAPPPPKAPPVKRDIPPPVLSPQMGREDEDRLRQEATGKIQRAEQTVQQVDQRKLAQDQQDTYTTIRSFIANARDALLRRDFLRATNLAEKAEVLADDLLRSLR
jgi:hypothetical protein